jgi:arabinose-5-phosphate isomerase
MHKKDLPLLGEGALMTEAILAMTSGGFGVVGITNAAGDLTGVITDGDLRRFVRTDLGPSLDARRLATPVVEVMTKNPVTIAPTVFAAEALDTLQSRKISVLFAVEDGKPVGILHTLDLLRVGVA